MQLGRVTADHQVFLFTAMDAVRTVSSDIQGVLGQVFLSQFDYLLDVRAGRMEIGKRQTDGTGTRTPLLMIQGRPVVQTNLGPMVLDSGAHMMVRFGVEATHTTRW